MDPRVPSGQHLYDDFTPRFDWLHEEKTDTLLVDLPGFKKEQLRVQLDNYGNLKISGERQVVGNRWKRFRREFKLPESCNASEMRAKFDNGLLYVIMPKLLTTQAPDTVHKPQAPQAPPPPTQVPQKPADHAPVVGDAQKSPTDGSRKEDDDGMKEKGGADGGASGAGRDVVDGSGLGVGMGMSWRRRKVAALNVVAALVVLVAIGVYVVYWWKKGRELLEGEARDREYVKGETGNGVV